MRAPARRAVGEIPHGTRSSYSYTDPGTTKAGGSYQYYVVATRDDGSGGGVSSEPSSEVNANVPGPPPTTTTTQPTTSTTEPGSTPGTTVPGSDPSSWRRASWRRRLVRLPRPSCQRGELPAQPPPTLPDTGFNPTLDYTDELPLDEGDEEAQDDPSLSLPSVITDGFDGRRPTLVLIAAGLALFVFAMHLRLLARRVEPIEKPLS